MFGDNNLGLRFTVVVVMAGGRAMDEGVGGGGR